MTTDNKRPLVWVGHVVLRTRKQRESEAFLRDLGIRYLTREDNVVILELRGGTHLILLDDADAATASDAKPGEETGDAGVLSGAEADVLACAAPFDLMVDDLDAAHGICKEHGLNPEAIDKGSNHRSFSVAEPSGHRIKFFDSHVSDNPV